MLSVLVALIAALTLPARPSRYVTDHAGVIDAMRAHALNERLAQFERDTSDQILVYVDRRVPSDTTLEEFGAAAIKQWGVGQKGKDNGAILFVFVDDRKMRIEVGYGLEGSLTDAKSKFILSNVVKPKFRAGDFAGGIEAGTNAMMQAVRGEAFTGSAFIATDAPYSALKTFGRSLVPVAPVLVLLILFLIRALQQRHKTGRELIEPIRARGWQPARSWPQQTGDDDSSSHDDWDTSSRSSSSSSSSSSSDSGFSGGGGSGGGGGASDSW